MPEAITLFSGGGLLDVALERMGYDVVAAFEREPAIAEVHHRNHPSTAIHGDVTISDFRPYAGIDLLHASPPCQGASTARSRSLPRHKDADVGVDVVRAVDECRPRLVTLENVPGYLKEPAYLQICRGMRDLGYWLVSAQVWNYANLGGPQSRRRLFAIWVRGDAIATLPPEIANSRNLFGEPEFALEVEPRKGPGWYAAIADLLESLPDGDLAPWQAKALAHSKKTKARALLVHPTDQRTCPIVGGDDPSFTITTTPGGNKTKALLIPRIGARLDEGKLRTRQAHQPAPTIKALGHDGHWRQLDALLEGTVKNLNPRCFARLQGLPDTFWLPPQNDLACRVVGNGVPPGMYEAVVGRLVGAIAQPVAA